MNNVKIKHLFKKIRKITNKESFRIYLGVGTSPSLFEFRLEI